MIWSSNSLPDLLVACNALASTVGSTSLLKPLATYRPSSKEAFSIQTFSFHWSRTLSFFLPTSVVIASTGDLGFLCLLVGAGSPLVMAAESVSSLLTGTLSQSHYTTSLPLDSCSSSFPFLLAVCIPCLALQDILLLSLAMSLCILPLFNLQSLLCYWELQRTAAVS